MIPSFLWSTVNTHDFQPVVDTGRFKAPSDELGVAGVATSVDGGRSMIAMVISDYFSVSKYATSFSMSDSVSPR
jgi:hypothetical protein